MQKVNQTYKIAPADRLASVSAVSYTHLTLPTTSRRQRQMCIRDRHK